MMTAVSANNQLDVADFSETVEVDFHNVSYSVTVSTVSSDTLCIEVEQCADACKWKGEFTARYVEDITAKTGNFKKFPVFVRMLLSALKHQSDSVFVDLLTYQDLELLKSRKRKGQGHLTRTIPPNNKRYLILTYAAEFDRVHYPLPLQYDDNVDPSYLRNIIKQLRAELDRVRNNSTRKPLEASAEIRRLREENNLLRQELKEHQDRFLGEDGLELQDIVGELRVTQRERDLLGARVENAEADLERERGIHRRELRRKTKELEEAHLDVQKLKEQVRDLRLKCKELTQELESNNRRHSHDRLRTAYASGNRDRPQTRPVSRPSSVGGSRSSSRGVSPSSSRAPSPTASTSSAKEPYVRRPGSAPARGRFDPTEYVRQRRERERQLAETRSRAPTPPRSAASSGRNTPAGSRPSSAPRTPVGFSRRSSSDLHEGAGLTDRRTMGTPGTSRQPAWPGAGTQYSKFPSAKASERATSPGRALQDVKQKLTDFAKRQAAAVIGTPTTTLPGFAQDAATTAGIPSHHKVYDDPTAEIADIDSRLHALQNFLKMAKSNASS